MTERSRGQPEPRSTRDAVRGDSTAALLLAPGDSDAKRQARHNLLDTAVLGETHVVGVVSNDEQFIDRLDEHGHLHADAVTVVTVGSSIDHPDSETLDVTTVEIDAATTITNHVLDRIDEVSASATTSPQTILSFDSLTALIDAVGIERTFRFLDNLLTSLDEESVRANFHFDPTAHPRRARLALTTLFDTVLESSDGETWSRPGPSAR